MTLLDRKATRVVVVGFCMFVAAAAVIIATRNGAVAPPDSGVYVSVANNVSAGDGLTTFEGKELTLFPPGHPVLLAVGSIFGVDARDFARVLNALAFAIVVLLSYLLLRRHLMAHWLAYAGTVLVALTGFLVLLYSSVLAEAPFLAVTLGFLVVLEWAYRNEAPIWGVAAAAALAAAASLFRYAGPALIAFGAGVLAWQAWTMRQPRRLWRVAPFVAISAWVPVVWIAHNLAQGPHPFGLRYPATSGPLTHMRRAVDTVGSWLVPDGALAMLGVALVVAAVVGWALIIVRRPERKAAYGLGILATFVVFYLSYAIVASSISRIDPLNDRLLSPVFVPLLVIVLAGLETVLEPIRRRQQVAAWVAMTVFGLWAVATVWHTPGVVNTAADGLGFVSPAWESSELLDVAAAAPSAIPLYSNVPDGIYYARDRQPVVFGPTDHPGEQEAFVHDVLCVGPVQFAHFGTIPSAVLAPDDLGPAVLVDEITVAADGTLYRITAVDQGGAPDCEP